MRSIESDYLKLRDKCVARIDDLLRAYERERGILGERELAYMNGSVPRAPLSLRSCATFFTAPLTLFANRARQYGIKVLKSAYLRELKERLMNLSYGIPLDLKSISVELDLSRGIVKSEDSPRVNSRSLVVANYNVAVLGETSRAAELIQEIELMIENSVYYAHFEQVQTTKLLCR